CSGLVDHLSTATPSWQRGRSVPSMLKRPHLGKQELERPWQTHITIVVDRPHATSTVRLVQQMLPASLHCGHANAANVPLVRMDLAHSPSQRPADVVLEGQAASVGKSHTTIARDEISCAV